MFKLWSLASHTDPLDPYASLGMTRSISEKWNAPTPGYYVLDHKGVIRYKGVRGKKMDEAVDKLLAEMEKTEVRGQ